MVFVGAGKSKSKTVMEVKLAAHMLKGGSDKNPYRAIERRSRLLDAVRNGPVECSNGRLAGEWACENMNLVNYLDCEALGTPLLGRSFVGDDLAIGGCWVSDIWGWTSPAGTEYALVSTWDGTSIVDIDQGKAVVFVNGTDYLLDGYANIWRDVKVLDDVMFCGSEVTGHGIQAFDLRRLDAMPRLGVVPTVEADWIGRDVGSTHNIVAVPSLGLVLGVGLDSCSLATYDASDDRLAPVFVGCYYDSDIDYVHDAHCVDYRGPDAERRGNTICALWAETAVFLVDLTSFSPCRGRRLSFGYFCGGALDVISKFTYDAAGYAHQGWFSEDHSTLFCDDEADEILRRIDDYSRSYVFDVSDLENPTLASVFVTPSAHPSIDHNLYVKGNYIYQAAYTSGARIREIQANRTIREVAYADLETSCECVITEPYNASICDCDSFLGIWTYFPYFDSGLSIAGGSLEGLFILNATLFKN